MTTFITLTSFMSVVGTTPKRTRGRPPSHHKALLRWTRGTSHPLFGQSHGLTRGTPTPPVWTSSPDLVVVVPNRIPDHISWAIITHFAKSILDRTFLGLFRRPATTCPTPPIKWKDKVTTNHPPNNLCQPPAGQWWLYHPLSTIMTAKVKVFPPSKWQSSKHYKRPSTTQSKKEVSIPKKMAQGYQYAGLSN